MFITISDINEVSSSELKKWLEDATPEKQREINSIKVEKKRNERTVADHIKRKALSDYCGVDPSNIRFGVSEKGKPYAADLNVHFNVSHSAGIVVCAVSDKEIGIDIEKIKPINPEAAKKFACPDEIDYIVSHENGFFEIWTLKEAYFKCIGSGLGSNIKSVCFNIDGDNIICSDPDYNCSFVNIKDGYICSVCEKK